MAQLVNRLLRQAVGEEVRAIGLGQTIVRDHGAFALQLRLTENEGKDRDEQVERTYPQNSPRAIAVPDQALQNSGRIILAAPRVERKVRVDPLVLDVTVDLERAGEGRRQITQDIEVGRLRPDADDMDRCA
jgi:hypothetical protein